jgi:ureidoglycolate dehydrogenase (NAD+)
MTSDIKLDFEGLSLFCEAALIAAGASPSNAVTVAGVLVRTEARGIWTHGVQTLPNHIENVRAGGTRGEENPSIESESETTAHLDGRGGFGFVNAIRATEIAVAKAFVSGSAVVLVKNSNHFGAAGHYALLMAEAGVIGIVTGNTAPIMVVTGSRRKEIGNAPYAYGVPYSAFPIVLDIAMSTVAAMKVRLAHERHEVVPSGWVVDQDGRPSNDPAAYLEGGALMPMSGHKGYGLALFTEIISAALSGAAMTHAVVPWLKQSDTPTNVGHAIIAFSPGRFMGRAAFDLRLDELVNELHHAERAPDAERIFVPGEMEFEAETASRAAGIPVRPQVWEHLHRAAKVVDLEPMLDDARC